MEGILSSVLVACVAFALGLMAERQKQVVAERAKLLSEVSAWVNDHSTLIHCFSEDLANLAQSGQPVFLPDIHGRQLLAQKLATSTPRIRGIVQSGSLRTMTNRSRTTQLANSLNELDRFVRTVIIPSHAALTDPGFVPHEQPDQVTQMILQVSQGDAIVQTLHGLLAKISTSL
jgi:hypothetical protein